MIIHLVRNDEAGTQHIRLRLDFIDKEREKERERQEIARAVFSTEKMDRDDYCGPRTSP